jgi:alpha/beta superfamily hydrolase
MFKYLMIICLCITGSVTAQDISGNWYGFFNNPQGQKQRLQLQVQRQGNGFRGQMRSPDIAKDGIELDTITVKGNTLKFTISKIKLSYTGEWNFSQRHYEGAFDQLGNRTPLNFSRQETKEEELPITRPQDPSSDPVYAVEEVKFVNPTDKVLLSGTFTRPNVKGTFPVIILIAGAGQQNRNNEMLGHRPFAVLADYLVKHGIATLRFDSRGIGESTGNYDSSGITNFAGDVRAAVSYLRKRREVDNAAIGLLGHSEGGIVAEIVAASDPKIAFLIAMAAPGLDGREMYNRRLVQTAAAYGEKEGYIEAYVSSYQRYLNVLTMEGNPNERKRKATIELTAIYNHFGDSTNVSGREHFIASAYLADTRTESLSLLEYDPAPNLGKIKCPVLAINGDKDMVTDAAPNLKAIENGLVKGGNELVTIRTFPGLNHLFQRCNTCSIEEYGTLDETINPAVLEFITRWVQLLY